MSREAILAAVRAQHGGSVPLPTVPTFNSGSQAELVARFRTVLEQVGGVWTVRTPESDLGEVIRMHYPEADRIVSTIDEPPNSTFPVTADTSPSDLVQVQLAIVRGQFGVAENAAVWVDDERLPHRSLPFVAEHLVLVLSASDIVTDMHAAYGTLGGHRPSYGVFISGPSKTADIEQALVIGAQGPRSLLVVLD